MHSPNSAVGGSYIVSVFDEGLDVVILDWCLLCCSKLCFKKINKDRLVSCQAMRF